jgi:hypothetical protein
LSVDPDVMETGEPYAFTDNDPLNMTDPLGLCWTRWGCGEFHKLNKYAHKLAHHAKKLLHSAAAHHILNSISKIAGGVSATASAAAVATAAVPVVGEIAEGISLTAGSVAVTADLANCVGGNCNKAQLALDAGSLILGVAASKLSDLAEDAEETASLAGRAAHASPNSLMNAQTAEAGYCSYERTASTIGFGLSVGGFAS